MGGGHGVAACLPTRAASLRSGTAGARPEKRALRVRQPTFSTLDIARAAADNFDRGVSEYVSMSDFSASKDENLLSFYESVREQVESDKRSGGRYRLAGESVKQYADRLRDEMDRRRLRFSPIQWD